MADVVVLTAVQSNIRKEKKFIYCEFRDYFKETRVIIRIQREQFCDKKHWKNVHRIKDCVGPIPFNWTDVVVSPCWLLSVIDNLVIQIFFQKIVYTYLAAHKEL